MPTRTSIGRIEDFPANKLTEIKVKGVSIVVARLDDGLCAVRNQCAHLPLPISGGKLAENVLTCPWHNSQFDVCSGKNLDWVRGVAGIKMPNWSRKLLALGKQAQPLTTYEVSEEDGVYYVEI